jgi:hypothetical protein
LASLAQHGLIASVYFEKQLAEQMFSESIQEFAASLP